jgi:hypothetical protein
VVRLARSGRKRACLAYVVSYVASCLTKHSSSAWWLLLGRLLGGLSTSLLFSSFEVGLCAFLTGMCVWGGGSPFCEGGKPVFF